MRNCEDASKATIAPWGRLGAFGMGGMGPKEMPFVRDCLVEANTPQRGDLRFTFTTRPGNGLPTPAQREALHTYLESYAFFEMLQVQAATAQPLALHLLILLEKQPPASMRTAAETYARSLFADY